MRRLGNLWPTLISFQNLLLAYKKARLGKSRHTEVAEFSLELEYNLLAIQQQLSTGEYRPGEYRQFTIYERKPRLISAAPFRDRVVQHALMNVVEPPLDKRLIYDCYACRQGKGVHAAVARYQQWARRYRYALKLDIKKYFPSIDREILKTKLNHYIKDRQVLALFRMIIDTGPAQPIPTVWYPGDDLLSPLSRKTGIPIGNLTSQFLANLYLNDLDHYVKENLRQNAYLRYVDDMVVLGDSKTRLAETRSAIELYLAGQRLKLHPNKANISPTRAGLNLLGYVVYPHFRRLRADNGHRFARRLRGFARQFAHGKLTLAEIKPSIQSWIGHARHADTLGLRRAIFKHIVFRRGTDQ